MSTVTANLRFSADYIVSTPGVATSQLGIVNVSARVRDITVINSNTVNIGGWSGSILLTLVSHRTADGFTYTGAIPNLEQNKLYEVQVQVTTGSGTFPNNRKMYINTADSTNYYKYTIFMEFMFPNLTTAEIDEIEETLNPKLVVTPPVNMTFPRWTPGIKDNLGNLVPQPPDGNTEEFVDYIDLDISGVTLELPLKVYRDKTKLFLSTEINRLKTGTYAMKGVADGAIKHAPFGNSGEQLFGTFTITDRDIVRYIDLD